MATLEINYRKAAPATCFKLVTSVSHIPSQSVQEIILGPHEL
jgi:hypothetical protein